MSDASLNDLANEVALDLPHGWRMEIHIENGAGWVELSGPDGWVSPSEFENSGDLEAAVRLALEWAQEPPK